MSSNLVNVDGRGSLTAAEILKYRKRVEVFLAKVYGTGEFSDKEKRKFVLDTGEKVKIDPGLGDNSEKLKYFRGSLEGFPRRMKLEVVKEDGTTELVPLGRLKKMGEFLVGDSYAGSHQTKTVEAGQCIVNALLSSNNPVNFSGSLNIENIKGFDFSGILNGNFSEIEKIWQSVCELSPSWHSTLKATGNKLVERYPGGQWHYGDTFMQSIRVKYNHLEDDRLLPGSIERWNPADIWFSTGSISDINSIKEVADSEELVPLTNAMDKLYESGDIIGISLKKLDNSEDPQILEVKPETVSKAIGSIEVKNISLTTSDKSRLLISLTKKDESNSKDYTIELKQADTKLGLRAHLKGGKNHMDGSCSQRVLEICLNQYFKEDQVEKCIPDNYIEKVEKDLAKYVLTHTSDFSDDTVTKAENLQEGMYPLNSDDKLEKQFGGIDDKGKDEICRSIACNRALEALKKLLSEKNKKQKEFITTLYLVCSSTWSAEAEENNSQVRRSALHLKVS